MSDWVRLWQCMPDDPKWLVVRRRASQNVTGVTVGHVISVFVHMMKNAGEWKNWGSLENWNDEVVAAALEYETEQVFAIRNAMQGLILAGDNIINWSKRQTKQSDSSAERTAKWRRRKRDGGDDNVTSGDEIVTTSDERETLCDAEEKRRESSFLEKKKQKSARVEISRKIRISTEEPFLEFWEKYPNKVGKPAARRAFVVATRSATLPELMAGLERYIRDKPPDREWCNPATWLNQDRWTDQPATAGKMNGHSDPSKVASTLVFVSEDTPQWEAWSAFYRTTKGTAPPKTNRGHTFERGWHFPTEWPPTGDLLDGK